jgi:hypothetical protein
MAGQELLRPDGVEGADGREGLVGQGSTIGTVIPVLPWPQAR